MKEKSSYVYIMANPTNTVTYIGVTSDLQRRIWEHQTKQAKGFTSKYNITKLVHYECFGDIRYAIEREKELKGWRREKKVALVASMNHDWHDLTALI